MIKSFLLTLITHLIIGLLITYEISSETKLRPKSPQIRPPIEVSLKKYSLAPKRQNIPKSEQQEQSPPQPKTNPERAPRAQNHDSAQKAPITPPPDSQKTTMAIVPVLHPESGAPKGASSIGAATSSNAPANPAGGSNSASNGPTGNLAKESVGSIRARFIAALEKNKEYPYIARKQGQTGRVAMAIVLDAAGNLQNVKINKSSGVSRLDNAAVALVRKVCPFRHDAEQDVVMNVSIDYSLN